MHETVANQIDVTDKAGSSCRQVVKHAFFLLLPLQKAITASSKAIALTILILLQLSCANSISEDMPLAQRLMDLGLEQGESVNRLSSYRVNGWRSIDEENLIITTGVNDDYLVTLNTPCFDLRSAVFIGFTTTAGSLDRFESIVVEGPGRSREFCQIRAIYKVHNITPAPVEE